MKDIFAPVVTELSLNVSIMVFFVQFSTYLKTFSAARLFMKCVKYKFLLMCRWNNRVKVRPVYCEEKPLLVFNSEKVGLLPFMENA